MRGRLTTLILICAANTWAAAFDAPAEEADEFHFVVLGDSQFHDPEKFNRVIDQARRLRPAFVIQVGDMIKGYNSDPDAVKQQWQRFANQVAPLQPIPYLPVPGNHDVNNGERKVDPRLERLFEQLWGPLYFSFVYKNVHLIALNSDSSEGANQITGKQLAWLEQTLGASESEHKFAFLHRPPMLTKNAERLHEVFRKFGVSHVFYGHHHHFHFYERDGIAYIMTNAAANSAHEHEAIGGFHQLLQVSVRGEEVAVAAIKADAIKPLDSVHPRDNYDYYSLIKGFAQAQTPLKSLGNHQHDWVIPLNNPSRRDIQVLVTCSSADNRWIITPKVIEPVHIKSGARHDLTLAVSHLEHRVPESDPQCSFRVPFQTIHGEWIDFEHVVVGEH